MGLWGISVPGRHVGRADLPSGLFTLWSENDNGLESWLRFKSAGGSCRRWEMGSAQPPVAPALESQLHLPAFTAPALTHINTRMRAHTHTLKTHPRKMTQVLRSKDLAEPCPQSLGFVTRTEHPSLDFCSSSYTWTLWISAHQRTGRQELKEEGSLDL